MILDKVFLKFLICFLFFYRLAMASPTDEALINKVNTHKIDQKEKSPNLEQVNSLKFPKSDSVENIVLPESLHLVGSSLGFGLNYLSGQVAQDSSINSNGLEVQVNFAKLINSAFSTHLILNKDGWSQISIGQRNYFADSPTLRPFYNFKLGTTMKPSEYLAGFIIYQRYFLALQTGCEFILDKVPMQLSLESHIGALGLQYSGSFLLLRKF